MSSPANRKLVIGIDFGTTFSGVSWLFCTMGTVTDQPEIVRRWPSVLSKNSEQPKVPSRIFYKSTGEIAWGYNIPIGVEPLQWFKLLLLEASDLHEDQRKSAHVKNARHLLAELDKTAVQVTADYLRNLWQHSLGAITRAKGRWLVEGTPIHVVLTVPAIWKDYARDRMKTAVKLAGILDERMRAPTTLDLVSEPEAAALSTIPELRDRGDLNAGNSFVVCDCGGGTVDIISYQVDKKDPLTVKECVEGDGALCGGIYPDEGFEAYMKLTIGPTLWGKMEPAVISKMLNDEWQHGIKVDFDGEKKLWSVDYYNRNGKRKTVEPKMQVHRTKSIQGWGADCQANRSDIKGMFHHSTSGIIKLIQGQVKAIRNKTGVAPKFIILAGGFGRCLFLFNVVRESFDPQIDVLQTDGEKPWTAVCRGAVLYGVMGHGLIEKAVQVRSRISRLNYGWAFNPPFDPDCHDPRDEYWDDVTQEFRAHNQMEWGIKRGDDIDAVTAKTFEYNFSFEDDEEGYQSFERTIYTNASSQPPNRLEPACERLSTKEIQIPVKVEWLPFKKNGHHRYRSFDFETRMNVSGASLDVSHWHEGFKFGNVKLDIASD